MNKCFITGGAGFIGCHLVEKLVNIGKEVLVYDNLSFGRLENLRDCLNLKNFIHGDLADYALLEQTIKEFMPDVVFHLAAIHFIPYCNTHRREAVKVNVDGTHSLLEICSRYKPRKVIFASTAAVYPPSDNPHKESDRQKPFDIYGATKICGETLMQLFNYQSCVPVVICRFFNAYGPKETNDHVIPHIIKQLKVGNDTIQIGNVSPRRDYIYTADMVNALIKVSLGDNGCFEVFNVGTGKEYSVEDLISRIGSIMGRKLRIESVDQLKRRVERDHLCSDNTRIHEKTGWFPQYDINKGLSELMNFEFKESKVK